jgi:hypothetical protein
MPATKARSDRDGRGKRLRVRSLAVAKSAAPESAEITVGKASFEAFRQNRGAFRKMLTTYADAVAKAERLGRPLELVIQVRPDRAAPVIEERAADGDALDRALAAARARGVQQVAEILKSPDMVSAREFGKLIGASHETVNQKRKAGELLALEGATRGLRYPRWQVTEDGRPLPGLAELTKALGGGPWTVYRFLLQPHNELNGRTGLEALKANRVEAALETARSIADGAFA